MPVLYKICDDSRYNRLYNDCLDIERGRIRGIALAKKSFTTRDAGGYISNAVETPSWWYEGILQGAIEVIPTTRGTFDGGRSITVPGYGKIENFAARKSFTVEVHDPEHKENWLYYAKLSERRGQYHLLFITETQLRISDTPVNIDVGDPVEEDVDTGVLWTCTITWTQDKLTVQSFDAKTAREVFEVIAGGMPDISGEWAGYVCELERMPEPEQPEPEPEPEPDPEPIRILPLPELPNTAVRNSCHIWNNMLYMPIRGFVEIFDFATEQTRRVSLPGSNVQEESIIINNMLYMINGMYVFDLATEQMRTVAMPIMQGYTMYHYNGKIYMPQGRNNNIGMQLMGIFDLVTEQTRTVALPNITYRGTGHIYNDRIYMPGSTTNIYTNEVFDGSILEIFDLTTEQTRTVEMPNKNAGRNSSRIYNNKIYIVCSNINGRFLEIFDLITEQTRTVEIPNTGRCNILNDKLYIYGTEMLSDNSYNSYLNIFDLTTEQTRTVSLPITVAGYTNVIDNNNLYIPDSRGNLIIIDLTTV